ncbi:MAG TPA: protoheme IX farnesyltransferase [Pseudobdellovibrionaceae bacterium]|nr:protoheme IX farnesyltransferase [Pseudobdellovibrionaceae bacterium]
MLKVYADLTKFGIVVFSLFAGVAGYATGFLVEQSFDWRHLLLSMSGLYFLSSGSLALNQLQEYKLDRLMPRTAKRPIASGKLKPAAAGILAAAFLVTGLYQLAMASDTAAVVGLVSVVLYNGFYTMWWKRKWAFAAVPGAIPGSLPITIGYAASNPDIFNSESIYLFLIMFLWQMPHFWVLAIRFKDDYRAGGVPVLPTVVGVPKTLFHIGLYTFVYVGVALAAPWFVQASWVYLLLVVPFAVKLLIEFFKYQKDQGRWFPFFMWTNVSMLVFIIVPVIDKWNFLFIDRG